MKQLYPEKFYLNLYAIFEENYALQAKPSSEMPQFLNFVPALISHI